MASRTSKRSNRTKTKSENVARKTTRAGTTTRLGGTRARSSSARRADTTTIARLIVPSGGIDLAWPAGDSPAVSRLQRLAMEWTHVVRNRARWAGTPSLADEQDARARELLKVIGVSETDRHRLAEAGAVQVSVDFTREEHGWEARILPWEFILPAATRDLRTRPLVVTRVLRRGRRVGDGKYASVLFVESAPGRLAQEWDFGNERRLVQRYIKPETFERLKSPSASELTDAIKRVKPDIVHLSGFDTHQGLALLKDTRSNDTVFDGYLLTSEGDAQVVTAAMLSEILTAGGAAPTVVFCNIWNSAGRIAPLLVAAGVGAAIGFQDGMDDALAEMFVGSFYRALGSTKDVEAAFGSAWQVLTKQPKPLRGSGIVLWRGAAMSERTDLRSAPTPEASDTARTVFVPQNIEAERVRDLVTVAVEHEPQFSYGLLHNDRDLFRKFLIHNLSDGSLVGVQVFVELHSNDGTYPFRETYTIDDPVLDLSRRIRIALTSNLARTLDEVLRTSLYVEVKWGEHALFRQTFPVSMAPVDQWADTDSDRIFLPSFVFPRDRAVATVIRNAEHFVTTLRDDPGAGFDGYQAIDEERDNPAEDVDRQVQALWYSVVYRVPASYINPPPTYTLASQRIRTPSEIITGGFGTCIDLALLLASCLEAVEIHPVIFLLNDHAFPGYWRTEAARESFCRRVASSASNPGSVAGAIRGGEASAKRRPGAPWCFDAAALEEVRRSISRHQLVPLESVGLTRRSSFRDAVDEAREYFLPEEEDRFLMMLDVRTARDRQVTPLPLGPRLQ